MSILVLHSFTISVFLNIWRSQAGAWCHYVRNLAGTGQILTLLLSRDIFAVDKSSRSVAGSRARVSSSQGNFFLENFTGGGTLLSPLIKLNKNSVNMELDLRSEVNTIHNSYHVTQLCLLIGRTDDWGNHSELGLVDLINNSLHLFNFLSLFSTLKCSCSCWCWYVNQSIPLVSIFPIQFLSFNS